MTPHSDIHDTKNNLAVLVDPICNDNLLPKMFTPEYYNLPRSVVATTVQPKLRTISFLMSAFSRNQQAATIDDYIVGLKPTMKVNSKSITFVRGWMYS